MPILIYTQFQTKVRCISQIANKSRNLKIKSLVRGRLKYRPINELRLTITQVETFLCLHDTQIIVAYGQMRNNMTNTKNALLYRSKAMHNLHKLGKKDFDLIHKSLVYSNKMEILGNNRVVINLLIKAFQRKPNNQLRTPDRH